MSSKEEKSFPFVYGAQYYRAPTPGPEFWERDLEHMKRLGFNTVKYWVQWRWSEREPGQYCWDDLDRLLELAEKYGLHVVLNLICDVMPVWAERLHPDCRMIDRRGLPVLSEAVVCRQIGGYPGPCLNHPAMLESRQAFFRAALEHFNRFPALLAWDVWNEPEHHLGRRSANNDNLLCYCSNCERKFKEFMWKRYGKIEKLNRRWGRCYRSFDNIELPRDPSTIADFIDWREFQLDSMTEEAMWRLNLVRELAPETFPHLHVVPHTIHCFNSANCVDDFVLAELCNIFGSTMVNDPFFAASASSSAGEKLFYNAEWHINFGSTAIHPRIIDRTTFFREAIPQLAWNVRGYLYWQFRPETLGFESPAWGIIRPDGSDRLVSRHAKEFIHKLALYLPELMKSRRAEPQIAILKSRRNELFFHSFPQNKGNWLYRSIRGWMDTLLTLGAQFRFVSSEQLERAELNGLRILILPAAYYMSQAEADAADRFLHDGGTLIAEGSVAGYSHDTGRHSTVVPGCGLAERWGVYETESVSTFHLDCSESEEQSVSGASGDTAKALNSVGAKGGEYLPLQTRGECGFGALNLSSLTGEEAEVLASAHGMSCVLEKRIGKGRLIYAGTYLGIAAKEKSDVFLTVLLNDCITRAGIKSDKTKNGIYVTPLYSSDRISFFVAENRSDSAKSVSFPSSCRNIFDGGEGETFELSPRSAALFAVE